MTQFLKQMFVKDRIDMASTSCLLFPAGWLLLLYNILFTLIYSYINIIEIRKCYSLNKGNYKEISTVSK